MVPTQGVWLADAQSAPILGLSWSRGRYLSGAAPHPGSPQGDRQQQARHVPQTGAPEHKGQMPRLRRETGPLGMGREFLEGP